MAVNTNRSCKAMPMASSSLITQFFSKESAETETVREEAAVTEPNLQTEVSSSHSAELQDDTYCADSSDSGDAGTARTKALAR